MKIEININDIVEVTLTTHGERVLESNGAFSYRNNYNQDTRVLTEQLWVIINTFGKYMYNGCDQIIENNSIAFWQTQFDGVD